MQAAPQQEHQWLQKLVGEWTMEGEFNMGPGQPPMKSKASEVVRSLGGLWFIAEGTGEMPDGGLCSTIMTLGYDPRTKRFVGTWIGSMMTHLWIYDGELDPAQKVLTLNADGPRFTDPTKMAKYKDVIELKNDDHRLLTSHLLGDDGKWTQFMTAHYQRTKKR
jgi:hypothetical protein